MAAIMDTSGTGSDAAAAMEGLTVEGLSARQLEVMQQLLESQLKVERERHHVDVRQQNASNKRARGIEN